MKRLFAAMVSLVLLIVTGFASSGASASSPSPVPAKAGLGKRWPDPPRGRARFEAAHRNVAPQPSIGTFGTGVPVSARSPASGATSNTAVTRGAWTSLGPQPITQSQTYGNVSGRVDAFAVDPTNPSVIYAGTAGGGVWKTNDGGAHWLPLTDTQSTLAISALAIDPSDHNVIYAGTGDRDGRVVDGISVLKSVDGGATWSLQTALSGFANGMNVGSIAIDRSSPSHVLAATDHGLFVTNDGGSAWTENTAINGQIRGAGSITDGIYQILQDPDNPSKFWATVADLCQSEYGQILVSADSGGTWTAANNFPNLANPISRIALGLGPGGVGYAVTSQCGPRSCSGCDFQLYDIEKTLSGGSTWSPLPSPTTDYLRSPAGGQGWYDNVLAVDPSNTSHVVFGGIDLMATIDGGSTYSNIGNVYSGGPVHPDQHAITFLGANTFLLGGDGGVYKTTNLGGAVTPPASWSNLNATLDITEFYAGVALDPTHFLGGSQDNSSPGSFAGVAGNPTLPAWIDYGAGDGGYPAIDPTPGSKTIYTSGADGFIFKLDRTVPAIQPSLSNLADPCDNNPSTPACNDPVAFMAPFLMDPDNPQHLLAATNRVYQSSTGGLPSGSAGWPKVSPVLTSGHPGEWISAMNVSPGGSVIVTGSVLGAVWRSVDGGNTWSNVTGNLPAANLGTAGNFTPWITDVIASPSNPSELWVSVGQLGQAWIFHTSNAGAGGGTTWNSVSGPVDFGTVYALALDPVNPSILYVGGASGVFECIHCNAPCADALWNQLGSGLPNAIVKYISFTADRSQIIAWTWGRGAWTIPTASGLTTRAALPAMADAAYGGYTTVTYATNLGAVGASVSLHTYDTSGGQAGLGDGVGVLPPHATVTWRQDDGAAFWSTGTAGSGILCSDQPLAAFVNEFAPGGGDATSYTSTPLLSGVSSTIYAPAIANNAYGGYTTGIGLINLGDTTVNVTVTYRDSTGAPVKTQHVAAVAPQAYQALYSGDAALGLPSGFAGSATISSDGLQPLAAVVNETGPGGQLSSYDAVPAGSTTLYAPAALRNAYGGFNTGIGIQNTTGTAGTVTITYFDPAGNSTVKSFPISANGYLGVYQGTDIPVDGAYTAKITSTVSIAAVVNEIAPLTVPNAQQSTAYNTFTVGASSLNLPLVENAGSDGWSTGEGIMNTGSSSTTVTVTYYDADTGAAVGTPQSLTLAPNAYWGLYQPTGGLASGTRASAMITTSPGGKVAVVCNESSATSFMSYSGE